MQLQKILTTIVIPINDVVKKKTGIPVAINSASSRERKNITKSSRDRDF